MTYARLQLGERGESLARAELERRGYLVVAARYRTRYGEIDLVCDHGGVLVFVEVKARTSGDFGHPAEAVTDQKQRRVVAMAESYLWREKATERICRFDVVAVEVDQLPPHVTVYVDAFRPGW